MKVGDKFILARRYSNLNGWSCRPDLDGQIAEVTELEDRVNGSITFKLANGETGLVFRDAVGAIYPGVKVNLTELEPT